MKFTMMVGLAGSGKSTFARDLAEKEDAVIFNSDAIREELFGSIAVQDEPFKVFSLLHARVIEALKNGQNVIYDSTDVSVKSRRDILQRLKYLRVPVEKEAIVVARPLEDCSALNSQREIPVPNSVIKRMFVNFQMPYYFEGFDSIKIEYPNPDDKGKYGSYRTAFNDLLDYDQNNPWHPETLGVHLLDVHSRLQELKLTDDNVLYQTALLHDIGKPYTRKLNKETGICGYPNHASAGAYLSLFYSDLTDPIRTAAIITYHNDTIEWNRNPRAEEKFKERTGLDFYNDVKALGIADHPIEQCREQMAKEYTPKVPQNKKVKERRDEEHER